MKKYLLTAIILVAVNAHADVGGMDFRFGKDLSRYQRSFLEWYFERGEDQVDIVIMSRLMGISTNEVRKIVEGFGFTMSEYSELVYFPSEEFKSKGAGVVGSSVPTGGGK